MSFSPVSRFGEASITTAASTRKPPVQFGGKIHLPGPFGSRPEPDAPTTNFGSPVVDGGGNFGDYGGYGDGPGGEPANPKKPSRRTRSSGDRSIISGLKSFAKKASIAVGALAATFFGIDTFGPDLINNPFASAPTAPATAGVIPGLPNTESAAPEPDAAAPTAEAPAVDPTEAPQSSTAVQPGDTFTTQLREFFPDSTTDKELEDNPFHTLEAFRAGEAPYVSVVADPEAFAYGTELEIDGFEDVLFKAVGENPEFINGQGTGTLVICSEEPLSEELNQQDVRVTVK